jgi:putative acyl-CoA dehydrogenase
MTALQPIDRLDTHDVFNQVPPFENRNLFTGDRALVDAVNSAGAGEHGARLAAIGQCCGSAEVIEWGVEANRQTPVLETYDRYGHRVDEVRFHPAYHDLMRLGLDSGFAASAWDGSARGHTLHAAILFLTGQADSGTSCPMTMTYAAVPALRAEQAVADVWVPRIAAGLSSGGGESGRHDRHGDDRKAGRQRRARQHDARRTDRRGGLVQSDGA